MGPRPGTKRGGSRRPARGAWEEGPSQRPRPSPRPPPPAPAVGASAGGAARGPGDALGIGPGLRALDRARRSLGDFARLYLPLLPLLHPAAADTDASGAADAAGARDGASLLVHCWPWLAFVEGLIYQCDEANEDRCRRWLRSDDHGFVSDPSRLCNGSDDWSEDGSDGGGVLPPPPPPCAATWRALLRGLAETDARRAGRDLRRALGVAPPARPPPGATGRSEPSDSTPVDVDVDAVAVASGRPWWDPEPLAAAVAAADARRPRLLTPAVARVLARGLRYWRAERRCCRLLARSVDDTAGDVSPSSAAFASRHKTFDYDAMRCVGAALILRSVVDDDDDKDKTSTTCPRRAASEAALAFLRADQTLLDLHDDLASRGSGAHLLATATLHAVGFASHRCVIEACPSIPSTATTSPSLSLSSGRLRGRRRGKFLQLAAV